jgi:hypothetical protein
MATVGGVVSWTVIWISGDGSAALPAKSLTVASSVTSAWGSGASGVHCPQPGPKVQ